MSKLTDKAAYIRGLAEGMKLDEKSDEGKLFASLIDALGDMASAIADLEEAHNELSEYVDSIDEDLSELEENLDDDDDDDEDDDEDDDFDFDEDKDDEDDDEDVCDPCGEVYAECMCPECKRSFYAPIADLDTGSEYVCPHCDQRVKPNPDYEDDVPVARKADPDQE
ncbi:MAG: hypothetical protein GX558_06605 [Clostridiales bacterium]|nr:hypothetical protein [Clostridiales bacterium]